MRHELLLKLMQDRGARSAVVNAALQMSTTALLSFSESLAAGEREAKDGAASDPRARPTVRLLPVDFSRGVAGRVALKDLWLVEQLALLGLKVLCVLVQVRCHRSGCAPLPTCLRAEVMLPAVPLVGSLTRYPMPVHLDRGNRAFHGELPRRSAASCWLSMHTSPCSDVARKPAGRHADCSTCGWPSSAC